MRYYFVSRQKSLTETYIIADHGTYITFVASLDLHAQGWYVIRKPDMKFSVWDKTDFSEHWKVRGEIGNNSLFMLVLPDIESTKKENLDSK